MPESGQDDHGTMSSQRRRHMPEQIGKLAEGHKRPAARKDLDEVCHHLQVAESTWHRRLSQYGAVKASDAKWLGGENARLKKLPAEAALTLDAPMGLAAAARRAGLMVRSGGPRGSGSPSGV